MANEGSVLLREMMRMLMEAMKIFRRARLLYVCIGFVKRARERERRNREQGFYAPRSSVRFISTELVASAARMRFEAEYRC